MCIRDRSRCERRVADDQLGGRRVATCVRCGTSGPRAVCLRHRRDLAERRHRYRPKFVYLGPPQSPAYLPPEGFVTDVQVTPLPAESVSMSVVGPAATTTIPPWVRGGGGAIRSGSFWIPPSESSLSALSSSLDAAWQSSPWPWPYGAYQVTVTSASGPTNIILDLLLTT